MSTEAKPCRMCGAAVRVEVVPGQRRLGDKKAPLVERRVCTDGSCRSNNPNAARRLGDAV